MKLLLIIWYNIEKNVLCAWRALKNIGFDLDFYPLYKYYNDIHDSRDDYVDHFITYINESNPDIILWWYFGIPTEDMEKVIKHSTNTKNFMFNWDEPHNWSSWDIKNKAKFWDAVFVTCAQKLDDYEINGSGKAFLQFPGYDPTIHYPILDDKDEDIDRYECDISFVCTNLYEDNQKYPGQYINRKELVDTIYENQEKYGYKFNIYGSTKFADIYPKSYKGYLDYEDHLQLFNYSKINICTHVQCDTYKYLNERTIMILGCGGLLVIDKVDGIEELIDPNKECIILDKTNYMDQILDILRNYDKYYIYRFNAYQKSKLYTWDEWAKNIYYYGVKLIFGGNENMNTRHPKFDNSQDPIDIHLNILNKMKYK